MKTQAERIIIIILFSALLNIPFKIKAQTGSIKGTIKELNSTELITGANVIIEGTNIGSSSDFDGNFEIKGLVPGTYTIQVSFISYASQTIPNILVAANNATEVNIELEPVTQNLETVNIVATAIRDRESYLLMEQRKASGIVQHIGAQELSRKGIGDVATAVTKVTGISKIEGSNDVYVRGLGDRYNSTSFNGLPMPSNNPEQKNIALELFTTDIIEFITIDKVYNNRIYGDFAGGNVDIISKDFSGESFLKIDLGSDLNSASISNKALPLKEGPDYFGFYTTTPPQTLSEFDFDNNLNPVSKTPLGANFGISGGHKHQIGIQSEINFYASLNFGNDYSVKEGVAFGAINSSGIPHKDFRMKTYAYNTNSTAMINLGYKMNRNHKVFYNLVLINSSENSNEEYVGTIIDIADNGNGYLNIKTYEKNTIFINQLLGKHHLNPHAGFDWGFSYNTITSDVPDRFQNTFRMIENGNYLFGQNQITDNHRYFHYLKENELAGNLAFEYKLLPLSDNVFKLKFTLGLTGRYKAREFEATQFNFRILSVSRNTVVDPDNLSLFFNQQNLDNNFFRIETFRGNSQVPFALNPQVYGGSQVIQGGYLTTEYNFSPKFSSLIGLRAEYIYQEVYWNTQLDPSDKSDYFEKISFLPSFSSRYEINDKQNLRIGASKTYTLPQFKERAMFIFEEVTQVKIGNPDIYPSDNYNLDIKWEFFPKSGEVLSLGSFGKYILNPINEFAITSATNDISFLNTGNWGYVAGLEFEVRKTLLDLDNSKIFAGFNTSYMHTEQELNSEKVQEETIFMVNFTHEKARFTGASDLLMNADLTYLFNWKNEKNNLMATVSYSYFSDRIYAIGTNNRGNIIERPFNSLDLILKSEFKKLSLSLSFKNLLNPPVERYQANENSDALVISYKKGIFVGFGISYKF
ncbi:MAG: carboxypeptidase-like regulatory domain-containing protein [Bacteroidales bacterium]|nr:carboxypeptidase-like regulatory domain-containing protein [Bacteroidales bacterium]